VNHGAPGHHHDPGGVTHISFEVVVTPNGGTNNLLRGFIQLLIEGRGKRIAGACGALF